MRNIQLVNLLETIFKKNPIERITIDEIKRHCWFRSLPGAAARNKFNLKLYSHEEEFNVLLKPRTKYDDFYRSMSMTPYIHQMYYPIDDTLNVIQIHEHEIDEFENLKRIPIVRSNRSKAFNENPDDLLQCKLTNRILDVVGSHLEPKSRLDSPPKSRLDSPPKSRMNSPIQSIGPNWLEFRFYTC